MTTSNLQELIAAKAARGSYLFQTDYAEMPYHLALTNKQWDVFEARRGEIKTWLAERGMFCEFVSSKQSKRQASRESLDLFNRDCPEYNDAAFNAIIEEYTKNPTQKIGMLAAYKSRRNDVQTRFFESQPSGISLGFLTENDAMEFRLRWL